MLTVAQLVKKHTTNLYDPKIDYYEQRYPPLGPILRQLHPFHILALYFFKINFNIVLPLIPTSPK
jgi:hypothetical protein